MKDDNILNECISYVYSFLKDKNIHLNYSPKNYKVDTLE
jgi:hypothetical protein